MKYTAVPVPEALLQDRSLQGSAKLAWLTIALFHREQGLATCPSKALLQRWAGLARHTLLRCLARLQQAGWLSTDPTSLSTKMPQGAWPEGAQSQPNQAPSAPGTQGEAQSTAQAGNRHRPAGRTHLPGELLRDRRVSPQAKLLYAHLQRTPDFRSHYGQFTYTLLMHLTGVSRNTLKRAVRVLTETGWLVMRPGNKFAPIRFTLRNPFAESRQAVLAQVQRRIRRSPSIGEGLMREYLSLLIDSTEYADNASPAFLVNPFTSEQMEIDRLYYRLGVAFEFNGPQHYGPTERFPSEIKYRKLRGRDLMKMGFCQDEGIQVVVILPEDLSLEGIRRKLEGLVPLRSLQGQEEIIAYLESRSRQYRQRARAGLSRGA